MPYGPDMAMRLRTILPPFMSFQSPYLAFGKRIR